MNKRDYDYRVHCSFTIPSSARWNIHFLVLLDTLGLELKPITYRDPTGQGMDMQAPEPFPEGQITWPPSIMGVKS